MEEDKVVCPRCEGSGLCIECNGKGFIPCPDCKDNPTTSCKKCSGTGKISCEPKCEVCDGKGFISYSNNHSNENIQELRKEVVIIPIIPAKPVATFTILILCVLYTVFSGAVFGKVNILYFLGLFFPPYVIHGEWWRFITSMFLHGNWIHLLCNMYFLYAVGITIERLLGTKKYLILYFISGIMGSIASMIAMPETFSVGASGALFGVFASYFALNRRFHCFPPSMMKNLYFWLGINIVIGLMGSNINFWAHVGGFLGGYLFIYFFPQPDKSQFKR